ncbi:nuclear transport factor 2 family protein [Solicola gregarius]|uniref:Nuclear transport factor 2 family protein n=1 Tax=Solicola gregarius TaxID=2908642 RepID=A0AA46TIK0_9ACTN|nr:nuclear transport factor 2 family protein [Solicola gregarius]UYM05871.1 nuclear transport factor 2 family protein [Solicola gregarius]
MLHLDPPDPIVRLASATNAGDTVAFLAVLSPDVYVNDWGREFRGHTGAASWNETDNIGVGAQITLGETRRGDAEDDWVVDVNVRSHRFNGAGTFTLTIKDGLITRLITG